MKVAIPLFENRVSPRFDCAPKVLVMAEEEEHALKWLRKKATKGQLRAAYVLAGRKEDVQLEGTTIKGTVIAVCSSWELSPGCFEEASSLRTTGHEDHNSLRKQCPSRDEYESTWKEKEKKLP